MALFDQLARAAHDRQRRESEVIHLEQADALEPVHFEFDDGESAGVVAFGRTMQRRVLDDGTIRDDDARRVRPRVARDAFEQTRIVNQLAEIIVLFVNLF